MEDILIIGGGTAGLAAAIYGVRAGHSVTVLEKMPMPGGQIFNTPEVENYPGIPKISGFDFSQQIAKQAKDLGAKVVSRKISSVSLTEKEKVIVTNKEEYRAKTVIIANGAQHRLLGCKGEDRLSGRGVSYCATCDGAFYKGKEVAIVGGGNTALEDALFLANNCSKVVLIHRRDSFRAHQVTVDAVLARENIEIVYDSVVESIQGEKSVESITVKNVKDDSRRTIEVSGVFVAVGLVPDNSLFDGVVELGEGGYIKAGEDCHTNIPGVFVAGDTRTKLVRQLVTAAADGAVAAVEASNYISQNW